MPLNPIEQLKPGVKHTYDKDIEKLSISLIDDITSEDWINKENKLISSDLNEHQYTYHSFAGVDIKAFIPYNGRNIPLAELQTLSYSVNRDTKPVRGLGSMSPLAYTRGTRLIAGSMIIYQFLHTGLHYIRQTTKGLLLDQIPPFNIIIVMQNEYGAGNYLALLDVSIITEGLVLSVQDLSTETSVQFFARDIQPLTDLNDLQRLKVSNYYSSENSAIEESNKFTLEELLTKAKKDMIERQNNFTY